MNRPNKAFAETSEEAIGHLNEARRYREMNEEVGQPTLHSQAIGFEQSAAAYLAVADPPAIGTGGEFAIERSEEPGLQPRLERPNRVNINASDERVGLLVDTDTVDMGLDLAESIQARDSVERMIAHQMAVAHRLAMKFGRRTEQELWRQTNPNAAGEASRAANSVARLMKAFQEGAQTLAKLRNGGQQVVTVQHVTVEQGGQAVVAGQVDPKKPGGLRRDRDEN